ncbi:hypothetical protein BDP27DRAFT_1317041 [Rhodocollybia butyracea]|uniref:histone deacetylase n=1 Tax=Rhodocollybia butyracea TaxID=206335 RepID=A0A9P5Q3J1_9AGAR|nr:hypothetical protein BDP27DRAFT_1317041 [Rhodocollybia butyracea]
MTTPNRRRVSYYYDPDVGSYTYGLGHPMKPHRILMTHELLSAYTNSPSHAPNLLLTNPLFTSLRPPRASAHQMTHFHTDEYIHFLSRVTPETVEELTGRGTQFLVGDDNPAFEGVWEFNTISAGGSIGCASRINSGHADIAINWAGGLHHAKKREASGFCYINDIVLCTLDLLRTFPRVLYIDIDCHHGDGVEEAFYTTDRVMTVSFHKYGEYFPGTGTQEDRGRGRGHGYALNIPLKDGMSDATFQSIFDPIISRVMEVFRPSVVVLQCGADSLSGDKLGCFNLTMEGHAHCTTFVRRFGVPMVFIGRGRIYGEERSEGMVLRDRMRFGCAGTAQALQQLKELEGRIGAPSVQLMDVPRESVGDHVGFFGEFTTLIIVGMSEGDAAMDKDEKEVVREREREWKDELDMKVAHSESRAYANRSYPPYASYPSYASSTSDSDSDADTEDEDMESLAYDSDASHRSYQRSTRSTARRLSNSHPSNLPRDIVANSNPAQSTRKRMSIITNMMYDISLCSGESKTSRRRFFGGGGTSDIGLNSAFGIGFSSLGSLEANGAHGLGGVSSSRGPSRGASMDAMDYRDSRGETPISGAINEEEDGVDERERERDEGGGVRLVARAIRDGSLMVVDSDL